MKSLDILIVEDNPINLKLACNLLEYEGHNIETAVNAEETIKSLKRKRFDIILMDIELPGTDGLQLTRMLKQDKSTAHIPVVAITAYAMKGDEQKTLDAGCIGYIIKPIDTRKFHEQILNYFYQSVKSKETAL